MTYDTHDEHEHRPDETNAPITPRHPALQDALRDVAGYAVPRRTMLSQAVGVAALFGLSALRLPFGVAALDAQQPKGAKWDDSFLLAVDLELAPSNGMRYHRPYLAVWVADAAGKPVRTIALWVQTTGRGPRYIRELRRWFGDQGNTQAIVSTVSSATRNPGKYSMTWDGRDDAGNAVVQGAYRLYIEAAQEHGTYGLMQQDLMIGSKPVALDVAPSGQIAKAHVEYRKKA